MVWFPVEELSVRLVRSKHEIAWIDKKLGQLKTHKSQQQARLKVVEEQLTKFKSMPSEDDPEFADTMQRSIMPVLNIAACGKKHAGLNKIRTDNTYGRSMSEFERGFTLETKHKPTKALDELEAMMNAPGATRFESQLESQ
eukprot:TRINITY_DN6289_c0_g1_i2.p1 TRINITY_DN6289_c0_g1~~TRINITY_DN6289_c0_g1_i2.p1  ORF type:complete len:141 (+),score=36.80 TRINITY_DN6289_c0_g1_i2:365-787(+)